MSWKFRNNWCCSLSVCLPGADWPDSGPGGARVNVVSPVKALHPHSLSRPHQRHYSGKLLGLTLTFCCEGLPRIGNCTSTWLWWTVLFWQEEHHLKARWKYHVMSQVSFWIPYFPSFCILSRPNVLIKFRALPRPQIFVYCLLTQLIGNRSAYPDTTLSRAIVRVDSHNVTPRLLDYRLRVFPFNLTKTLTRHKTEDSTQVKTRT